MADRLGQAVTRPAASQAGSSTLKVKLAAADMMNLAASLPMVIQDCVIDAGGGIHQVYAWHQNTCQEPNV